MSKKTKVAGALGLLALALLLVIRFYLHRPESSTSEVGAPPEHTATISSGAEPTAPANTFDVGPGPTPSDPASAAQVDPASAAQADGNAGATGKSADGANLDKPKAGKSAVDKSGKVRSTSAGKTKTAGNTVNTGVDKLASIPSKQGKSERETDAASDTSAKGSSEPAAAASSDAQAGQPPEQLAARERPRPEQVPFEAQCRNGIGSSLRLVRLTYLIDGKVVSTHRGAKLARSQGCEAPTGRLDPGNHKLTVLAEYQGTGYGVFSYHDGYRYKQQQSYLFTAREKGTTRLNIKLFEKGGAIVAIENRLAISFSQSASDK